MAPHGPEQPVPLAILQVFPFARFQPFDGYVHDPRAMERDHSIAERLAHAPNLPVSPLGKHDSKPIAPHPSRPTRLRLAAENDHAPRHSIQEGSVKGAIHLHEIFPFVAEFGAEDVVDDVAVVRQQNQTGRIFVQPSDRKYPLMMPDLRNDVSGNVSLARRRHADRLMVLDVEMGLPPRNDLPIPSDHVRRGDLIAELRHPTVDRDDARFN